MLIDHSNQRVLEVLKNRENKTLRRWLRKAKRQGMLKELQEVTIDMWAGFQQSVRAILGERVRVVADRFHVMSRFQHHLTAARRQIQKSLSAEEREALKGSRWLWVTNDENLSARERRRFSKLRQRFGVLKKLWLLRRRLRAIFEDRALTPELARARLTEWCQRGRGLGLKALAKFEKMLDQWMEPIVNYFVARSSNGRTEGFNHGLRTILWRSCGMRNFTHFRLRVLHIYG